MKLNPPRSRERAEASHPGLLPVGLYLLALTQVQRRHGNSSGKPYLWCLFEVIAHEHRGCSFWCAVSLDLSRTGTLRRWEVWSEAIGLERAVELDSDHDVKQSFLGRAFKAEVIIDELGSGKLVNDLGHIAYARHYTAEDRRLVQAWQNTNALGLASVG